MKKTLKQEVKSLKIKYNICKPIAITWAILNSPITFVIGGFKSTIASIGETKETMDDLGAIIDNLEEIINKEETD